MKLRIVFGVAMLSAILLAVAAQDGRGSLKELADALRREDEAAIARTVKEARSQLGDGAGVPEQADQFQAIPASAKRLSREEAMRVMQASYNLDPEWSGCAKHIDEVVLPGVREAFDDEATCLFLLHGNRVIAASAYNPEPGDGIHLVSGPCVLTEYRNRGIGGTLLHATLEALRAHGVPEACGQVRPGTPSAKFLCTMCGGHQVTAAILPLVAETAVAA